MANILIVDDEDHIRRVIAQLVEMAGYSCTLAADAAEARKILEDSNPELILCDVNLSGESGIDLTRHVLAEYPEIAVIMVTGNDDSELAETAIEIGAYGYVIKPFKSNELIISVKNALRRRELEIANRAHQNNLEQKITSRTAELQETLKKLRKTINGVVQAMALTVESRDPYTAGHQQRVADLSCAIATEMEFSQDRIDGIRMAGIIHDLGKISVPAEILSKPGRINEMEFGIIKRHPRVAYDILKEIDFPWPISQMVLQHHERMDGSGYPQELSGDEILFEAKILSVADVVEAMASHRPYRPALGSDAALEAILENKGILYDPDVVDACLKLFTVRGFKFK